MCAHVTAPAGGNMIKCLPTTPRDFNMPHPSLDTSTTWIPFDWLNSLSIIDWRAGLGADTWLYNKPHRWLTSVRIPFTHGFSKGCQSYQNTYFASKPHKLTWLVFCMIKMESPFVVYTNTILYKRSFKNIKALLLRVWITWLSSECELS